MKTKKGKKAICPKCKKGTLGFVHIEKIGYCVFKCSECDYIGK